MENSSVLDETYRTWLAGFVDGEGCFLISENKGSTTMRFDLSQSGVEGKQLLEKLKSIFGGTIYLNNRPFRPYHKQVWRWSVSSDKAMKFIRCILPYMKLKRDEAIVCMEYTASKKITSCRGGYKAYRPKYVQDFRNLCRRRLSELKHSQPHWVDYGTA